MKRVRVAIEWAFFIISTEGAYVFDIGCCMFWLRFSALHAVEARFTELRRDIEVLPRIVDGFHRLDGSLTQLEEKVVSSGTTAKKDEAAVVIYYSNQNVPSLRDVVERKLRAGRGRRGAKPQREVNVFECHGIEDLEDLQLRMVNIDHLFFITQSATARWKDNVHTDELLACDRGIHLHILKHLFVSNDLMIPTCGSFSPLCMISLSYLSCSMRVSVKNLDCHHVLVLHGQGTSCPVWKPILQ
jgi:hypothetical protein